MVLQRYLSTLITARLSSSPDSIKLFNCVANMASVIFLSKVIIHNKIIYTGSSYDRFRMKQ